MREAAGGRVGDAEAAEIGEPHGREPVLHRGDDRHGAARPPGRRRQLADVNSRPRCRRSSPPGSTASAIGCATWLGARRSSSSPSISEELATVSDAELGGPPRARGSRDPRPRRRASERPAGGSGTRPSARSRTRACPSASGGACTRRSRTRLMESGHRSYAADHLERAALASLDLEPGDRRLPDLAVEALILAGDRARRRMESRSALDYYGAGARDGRAGGRLGYARGSRAGGNGRGALLARRVPGRERRSSSARRRARREVRRRLDAGARPPLPGRHRDQRRRGSRRGGAAARRFTRCRRRARRRVGDVEVPAVRRVGARGPASSSTRRTRSGIGRSSSPRSTTTRGLAYGR